MSRELGGANTGSGGTLVELTGLFNLETALLKFF